VRSANAEARRHLESLTDDEKTQLREHNARRHELGFPAFMIEHQPEHRPDGTD